MFFGQQSTADELRDARQQVSQGSAVLIDVREIDEWNDCHLEDAQLFPFKKLCALPDAATEIPGLPKQQRVFVHCAKGGRAKKIAAWMNEIGYDAIPLVCTVNQLIDVGFAPGD